MADTPTVFPTLDADDFATRQGAVFPNGWVSPEARQPGGIFYALMKSIGGQQAFVLSALIYALEATRVQTAVGDALDLVSEDFFGDALPRAPGESDDSFRTRIEAGLTADFVTASGATRAAVSFAVQTITGVAPRIIEPWRPLDTGVIDGGPGTGMMFMDADCVQAPAIITDSSLAYQGFLQSIIPPIQLLDGNPLPCMDVGEAASGLYTDTAGSSMFDFDGSISLGEQAVYDAINARKTFGTVVWTQFVSSVKVT